MGWKTHKSESQLTGKSHYGWVLPPSEPNVSFSSFCMLALVVLSCLSVQFTSVTQSCPTICDPWTAAHQATLSITNSWSLLKLMSTKSVMPLTISFSVVPFSSCLQSFPASGSFPISQFFTSGGQSIGASASTPILPMYIQDWFLLGWTGLISLQFKGLSRSSPTTQFKSINSLVFSFLYSPALISIHDYWKNHSFD